MAHQTFNPTTPAGYQAIQDQIATLQAHRPALIARLKAARALGDLSENTEYSTAKRELRHLESRLRFLTKQLAYARVIVPTDDGRASLGKWVTLTFLADQSQAHFHLVSRLQAETTDLATTLAIDSPLGRAINGQVAGTIVTVTAPVGNYQVRLDQVTLPESR